MSDWRRTTGPADADVASHRIRLYGFPGSNAALTGRLMLDHKRLDYDLVDLFPGLHMLTLIAMGFQLMTVPAMTVDGRKVQGTRWIARELDRLVPDPPLFPGDPERRAAVEQAERRGEEIQDVARRIFFCAARLEPELFVMQVGGGRSLPVRMAVRAGASVTLRLAAGFHRASDAAGREDVAGLSERLDEIDAWIAQGVVGGAQLNAADYQIAVSVSGLVKMADLAPLIEDRAVAALADRVAPDFGRPIGPVLPDEWLRGSGVRQGAASWPAP
ncbi:MAG: glutathione S-transferase family protein [Solirubrobacteraceae bacterium]